MKVDGRRYALVDTRPGGLMVDLVSGALLELNDSGRAIWELALAGQSDVDIAAALAARHGLALPVAQAHVRDALSAAFGDMPDVPRTDFHYARSGADYVFEFRGERVFVVDERGERISLSSAPPLDTLPYLLNAIAPKLVALRGHTVLHASAVALRGRVIAFSGFSRAGKTSTARALVRAGAMPICEDKLMVRTGGRGAVVAPLGEAAVARWVAAVAETLASSKEASCGGLDRVGDGDTLPLVEIGFLDAQRRSSGPYGSAALSVVQTAGRAFKHSFYGSDAPTEWVRHLDTAAEIGANVRGFDLTMPEGLDRLADAAAALVRSGSLAS